MSETAVTTGTFDGFHLGHRHLADTLAREAGCRGLEPVLVTFKAHPLATLRPGAEPPLLAPRVPGEPLCGGMRTEYLDFTPEMAALTSRQFIGLLRERFNARLLVTGFNNRLGSDGPANLARYRAEGRDCGVEVVGATPFTLPDGVTVPSSSAIRRALQECRPEEAAGMLGHPYSLEGISAPGKQNGRRLGFPTINMLPEAGLAIPGPGVYAGLIDLPGHATMPAVINIGRNPTIASDNALSVEGHAIGARLPFVYGEKVRFTFVRYLRPERRFASLDELRGAITDDIAAAKG